MSGSMFQVFFNPRRLTGFGLSDGEVMERIWSFARRFARMTKEMRPSHRIDILTDALMYYCRRTVDRLREFGQCGNVGHVTINEPMLNNSKFFSFNKFLTARLLVQRMTSAVTLESSSTKEFQQLVAASDGGPFILVVCVALLMSLLLLLFFKH